MARQGAQPEVDPAANYQLAGRLHTLLMRAYYVGAAIYGV